MAMTNADTFKDALRQIEDAKDPAALVALFSDSATVDSPSRDGKLTGHASIEHFWHEYLSAFKSVRSTFTTDRTIGDTSVLEWVSEGVLVCGRTIRYRGVSIVTFRGFKVATFTTYYDSAAFHATAPTGMAVAAVPGPDTNGEGGD